jgi:hypothetical protein
MKKHAIVIALVLGLIACGPSIPKKPAGVPEQAFWAGDGKAPGAFVAIGVPDHEGWQVKIFDDHTGALLGQGLYVIHQGGARPSFQQEDFAGWDGKAVHLKDGGVLVPKQP